MQDDVKILVKNAQQAILAAQDLTALENIRLQLLGKKGQLTEMLKSLGKLPPEQRAEFGQIVNVAKEELLSALKQKTDSLKNLALQTKLATESIDITLPGRGQNIGSLHPITRIRQRVEQLFTALGFDVIEGPEIEDDYHNFQALNIPANHPARAMADTFYFPDGLLLRTHTSPVQIRVMENNKPPLRVITPGRVYRRDYDQTHTPMFHQLEGLVIDETCTFADLKGMLHGFLSALFEREMELRFRASYFPFTEPSAEVDIRFNDTWLEVLGCGMVHPQVLTNLGIDSERFTGFAFGIGLDRLAMLRYSINDLRKFFENDIRFLEQF